MYHINKKNHFHLFQSLEVQNDVKLCVEKKKKKDKNKKEKEILCVKKVQFQQVER